VRFDRLLAVALFALSPLPLAPLPSCAVVAYPQATVSLRVQGNVPDAQVTIDDIPVGALAYVASRGVALPPGRHHITVERTGYFPWDAVVEAKDDPIHLQINLVPIPD
jgi:PEGA domain